MTFEAYVARQKNILRSRHDGEEIFTAGGETYPVRSTQDILSELNAMTGLNGRERAFFANLREAKRAYGQAV